MSTRALVEKVKTDAYLMLYDIRKRNATIVSEDSKLDNDLSGGDYSGVCSHVCTGCKLVCFANPNTP